jgi:hypothetical protein
MGKMPVQTGNPTMEKTTQLQYLLLGPDNEHDQTLSRLIADALGPSSVALSPEIAPGKIAANVIRRAIEQADFVIADLSSNNPNVMYEVGYAHGLGKLVLPIVSSETKQVPVDLTGYHYLVYDPSKFSEFAKYVRNWAAHGSIRRLQRG